LTVEAFSLAYFLIEGQVQSGKGPRDIVREYGENLKDQISLAPKIYGISSR